jgi:Flp pilus assembly protein TadD
VSYNQAVKKGEAGDFEAEIRLLEKALKLDPPNKEIKSGLAMAYNDYGVSLGKKGDEKKEIDYLTKASKLDPENKAIQENLERAKRKGGVTEEAKPAVTKKKKTPSTPAGRKE